MKNEGNAERGRSSDLEVKIIVLLGKISFNYIYFSWMDVYENGNYNEKQISSAKPVRESRIICLRQSVNIP